VSLKHAVRQVLAIPLRFGPAGARHRLTQLIVSAAAARPPAQGLRELLAMQDEIIGQIDTLALPYGGGVHVKHRLMRYHDFFVDRIRATDRVVDVGCGYGAVAHSIAARAGATVVGLDMSAEQIARARARYGSLPGLSFEVGTAPDVLPAGRFDVVVASNVLEHIENRRRFLECIQARLMPARWLIRVPMTDRDWTIPLRQELGVRHFSDPTHFVEYTRQSFEQEMHQAGFGIAHLQINWGEVWAEVTP
jgi:SAM-dependent methyltransferase